MDCIKNIVDSLKKPKVERFFNLSLNPEITKDLLVKEGINLMKKWNKLGRFDSDPTLSTDQVFRFLNTREEFNRLLDNWNNNQIKKQLVTTTDLEGNIITSILPEIKENIDKNVALLRDSIDDIINNIEEFVRIKNIQPLTNPTIDGKSLLDFTNITTLVNNSNTILSLIDTTLNRTVTSVSLLNITPIDSSIVNYVVPMHSFIKNDLELNDNIMGVKSRWWANIVKAAGWKLDNNALYIKKEDVWVLNPELFKPNSEGKTPYDRILNNVKEKYDDLKLKEKSLLSGTNLSTTKTYVEMLLLVNFDKFIKDNFSNQINVNPDSSNTWGFPNNGKPKYALVKAGAINKTWAPDSSAENDISEYESKAFKLISHTIPFISVTGEKLGTYLDTIRINAIGGVLNDVSNSTIFSNGSKGYNISNWYKKIAKNEATFKEMLEAILNDYSKDENLYQSIHFIQSIYTYLYKPITGIHNRYLTELRQDIKSGISIINVESILFNQIRNVGKTVYRIEEVGTNKKSRSVDTLLLDTLVGDDFSNLFSSLSSKWISHSETILTHPFWKPNQGTLTNLLDFLTLYGDIEISPRAIKKYKTDPKAIDTFSAITVSKLKEYLTKSKQVPANIDENGNKDPDKKGLRSVTQDEWINDLKSKMFSGLDFISLFKSKHFTEAYNLVTSTKDNKGNLMPTLAIVNLGSVFNSVINNVTTKSPQHKLALESMNGFQVLLEVVTPNGSKEFSKLSAEDNITLDIMSLFYGEHINNGNILVQPWNLADKSKVLAQSVNMENLSKQLPEGQIITSNYAKNFLFEIQKDYFSDLKTRIIKDYSNVFGSNLTSLALIEKFLEGKKWENLLPKVEEYNINHKSNPLEFVEELHYSKYKNGLAFNQLLKTQFDIWGNTKAFEEFIKFRENSFLNNIKGIQFDIKDIRIDSNGIILKDYEKILERLKTTFKFTDDDFTIKYVTKEVTKLDENNNPILDEKGKPIKEIKEVLRKNGSRIVESAYFKNDGLELSEPLKKYFWTKNLIVSTITNASVKGTYIHPVKSNKTISSGVNITYAEVAKEEDERTVAFYKRMALLGGSITRFKQGGHDGIPEAVKVAYTEDPMSPVYNYSGNKDIQRTFDGAIPVNPFFTNQLIDAAPGANLSRVMKPLGISIQDQHMSFLKCAMFGINNSMILSSMNSEYSLYNWMEKMNKIPFKEEILAQYSNKTKLDNTLNLENQLDNIYIPHNGKYTQIGSIGLTDIPHEYSVMYKDDTPAETIKVSNFFELWNLFGGPLSKKEENGKLIFSEDSIGITNYIIKLQAINEMLDFKSDMISMIIPRQAVKNGISNVNEIGRLLKNNKQDLVTSLFNTEYLGIQLDASHSADESNISEVTQVLAALSENNTSSEYYNAVYNTIQKVINESLSEFRELGDKQLQQISRVFIKNLQKTSTINNARAIIDNLDEELMDSIPFSDRSLYKQFISTVLSNINKEFIRKKISGAGMILNPSQGMIKIYESNIGRTYLIQDLLNIYDTKMTPPEEILNEIDNKSSEFEKSELKIQYVLDNYEIFKPTVLKSVYQVNPLDTIRVIDKLGNIKDFTLIEIADYHNFISKYENEEGITIQKINNISRDLKPSQKSFTYFNYSKNNLNNLLKKEIEIVSQEEINNLGIPKIELSNIQTFIESNKDIIGNIDIDNFVRFFAKNSLIYRTGFNLETTRQRFKFEEVADEAKNDFNQKLKNVLNIPYINNFHTYLLKHNQRYNKLYNLENFTNENKFRLLQKYVERLNQRQWDVISNKKTFNEYYTNSPEYFENILQLQDGTYDDLNYGLDLNNYYKNTINTFNFQHKDAENISSKLYKSQFNLGNTSHADVSSELFNKMFDKVISRKVYKYYDVLINNLYDPDKALQIIFKKLESVNLYEKNINLKLYPHTAGKYLLDSNGNLVRSSKVFGEYEFVGKPVVISTGFKGRGKSLYKLDSTGKPTYKLSDDLKYKDLDGNEQYAIFKTADNKEIAIANSKNIGKFVEENKSYFGITDIWDSTNNDDVLYNSLISESNDFNFKRYLKNRQELSSYLETSVNVLEDTNNILPIKTTKEVTRSIASVKDAYFKTKSIEMFNSWKLSNLSISARIPAQAGQSYMSMQTVAHLHDDENSVYVSHWQLYLQGSDFDIDKLYMMSYNINNGILVGWSPYFSLLTDSDIKSSFQLPAPNGNTYINYNDAIKNPNLVISPEEVLDLEEPFKYLDAKSFSPGDRASILNYVNNNWNKKIHKYIKTPIFEVYKTIRNHNSFDSEEGLNNFKVYKMLQTSRNPKNQLTANTPISFGEIRSLKKEKENLLSMYDPYGMFKQQENNYIGKDVIGIAATGIKTYFSLVTYYSNYYTKGDINPEDNAFFAREYTILDKTRMVQNIAGLNLTELTSNVLKNKLIELISNKYEKKDGTFYTQEELFNFIDGIDDVENPALKLSALLSAATDNAKELLLADINAGIDFSGMHIFLIIMGFNEMDVARYMTSPDVLAIKEYIKDSFLNHKTLFGTDNLLNELTVEKLGSISKESIVKTTKEISTKNNNLISDFFTNNTIAAKIFNKVDDSKTNDDIKGLTKMASNSKSIKEFLDLGVKHIDEWYEKQNLKLQERKENKTYTNKRKESDLKELLDIKNNLLINFEKTFKKYKLITDSEDVEGIKQLKEEQNKLNNFKSIYFHSKEFIGMGGLLSINQGIKATVEDSYKVARKISNIVSNQQLSFFKLTGDIKIKDLNDFITAYKSLDIWESLSSNIQSKKIASINLLLGFDYDEKNIDINKKDIKQKINEKIADLLYSSISKDKPYLLESNIRKILQEVASQEIITKGIDYNKYFSDVDYRTTVISYYNLIKYTTNVLDVLDNLPHFKAMTEAFQEGNMFLEKNVLGYGFMANYLPKLLEVATLGEELTNYDTLSKIRNRGNNASNIMLNKDIIDKSQDTLFEIILIDWMKKFNFTLDLEDFILNNKFKDSLKMLVNDRKNVIFENVDLNNIGDTYKIDFSTEYGRAKFKYLMEIYLIPKFKEKFRNNGFFKEYTYKKGKGFNMRRTIKFYQNGSNFDVSLGIEKGLENITKNINNDFVIPGLVARDSSNINSIPIIDLLTIYDKMINLKRFGGNRSTVFFDKDKGALDSLASNLLEYQSAVEKDKEFLTNLNNKSIELKNDSEEIKEQKRNYRESLYLSLFGIYNKGIKSYTFKDPERELGELDIISKSIQNEYFTLVESVDTEAFVSLSLLKTTLRQKEILKKLKITNGLIQQKCT